MIQRTVFAVRGGREQFQKSVVFDFVEEQRPGLGEKIGALGWIQRRVSPHFRAATDFPFKDHSHFDRISMGETNTLERNSHLHDIAQIVDPAMTVPDDIHTDILHSSLEPGITLDTQRIDIEGIERLLIVEGVQIDTDLVIGMDLVPAID